MSLLLEGWKVLTHDLRLPFPGSPPVWSAQRGSELSHLESSRHGWTFHRDLPTAVRLSGLWPLGRPSTIVKVNVPAGVDVRWSSDFAFARRLRAVEAASEQDVDAAIDSVSVRFEEFADDMASEQKAWRQALTRPHWSLEAVNAALRDALDIRRLTNWCLERLESGAAVWDAWGTFARTDAAGAIASRAEFGVRDAFDARNAWIAHGGSHHLWRAWEPWTTPASEFTTDPKNPVARRDLGPARAAYAADFALTVRFAALKRWTPQRRDLLAGGVREAYLHGLEIAVPIKPRLLGWAMSETSTRRGGSEAI